MIINSSLTVKGIFLKRINRFLATVIVGKKKFFVHIPNSGRMEELLTEGAIILLIKKHSPHRKTNFDIIMTWYRDTWVAVDSRFPNLLVPEAIKEQKLSFFMEFSSFKREIKLGSSRIDFLLQGKDGKRCFLETKSVNLVKKGCALFPDAPTKRGTRHVEELINLSTVGENTAAVFIIQRGDAESFSPNESVDPLFGRVLKKSVKKGVTVLAFDCVVTPTEVCISKEIPVVF